MSETLYECDKCDENCKSTQKFKINKCNPAQVWIESTRHKITEIPEPVWVLDMPEELKKAINPDLWKSNGSKVEIVTPTSKEFTGIRINQRIWEVACSWLKQKPAEPTVEELQHRLNRIEMYIKADICISVKQTSDIIGLANGEK